MNILQAYFLSVMHAVFMFLCTHCKRLWVLDINEMYDHYYVQWSVMVVCGVGRMNMDEFSQMSV